MSTDTSLRRFYIRAFAFTWGVGGLALLLSRVVPSIPFDSTNPLYFIAAYGPTIAAMTIALQFGGSPGLAALLKRAIPRVSNVPWYAAVLACVAILLAAGAVMTRSAPATALTAALVAFPIAALTDAGPQGEELGWRGVALPRELEKRSALGAAVALGLIWSAWHLPTFFISTLTQHSLSIAMFTVETVALSIIMTWLFLRSRGDVFLMFLVHLASNFSAGPYGAPASLVATVKIALAVFIAAAGGLRTSRAA